MKLWAFNRRVVSDQLVLIEAETAAEARQKLDNGEAPRVVEDHLVIKQTVTRRPARDDTPF